MGKYIVSLWKALIFVILEARPQILEYSTWAVHIPTYMILALESFHRLVKVH